MDKWIIVSSQLSLEDQLVCYSLAHKLTALTKWFSICQQCLTWCHFDSLLTYTLHVSISLLPWILRKTRNKNRLHSAWLKYWPTPLQLSRPDNKNLINYQILRHELISWGLLQDKITDFVAYLLQICSEECSFICSHLKQQHQSQSLK